MQAYGMIESAETYFLMYKYMRIKTSEMKYYWESM
jgi:hypothetical protein